MLRHGRQTNLHSYIFFSNYRWKNSVLDVTSHTDWFIDSDHYLVLAKLRVKFKHTQKRDCQSVRFRFPHANQQPPNQECFGSKSWPFNTGFLEAMTDASKTNLIPISMTQRKRYHTRGA